MDIELLRRFEIEVNVTRAHQAKHERQLLEVCALGTTTTIDESTSIAWTPTFYHPSHVDGNKGSCVCLASAAVNVWDVCANSGAIHPAHVHDTKGSTVCLAPAAFKDLGWKARSDH